eukprot:COSAG05_NODE_7871_length_760_cov_1.727685_1_plen_146_part_01
MPGQYHALDRTTYRQRGSGGRGRDICAAQRLETLQQVRPCCARPTITACPTHRAAGGAAVLAAAAGCCRANRRRPPPASSVDDLILLTVDVATSSRSNIFATIFAPLVIATAMLLAAILLVSTNKTSNNLKPPLHFCTECNRMMMN